MKPKKERKQSFSFTLTPSLKARLDDKSEETGFGSSSRLLEKILSEHIDEY
ncbi:ribbon-helix-helix domain-containing protein [Holzapfeliella floricola]|uniref:ribbon-helix-helix domain-containing protein n=1 Tax=Holzapfeliella floricola TaxID=679249 RepID=UPI000A920DDB|nr:ribbon-helix-helix domain-containing protein [Holzapfeliella floricola]